MDGITLFNFQKNVSEKRSTANIPRPPIANQSSHNFQIFCPYYQTRPHPLATAVDFVCLVQTSQ
jgi:hypothetical protein